MTDVLTSIAGVSLGGGAVALLLVVLAKLTRGRYGARWRCWAWLLLALRLAVPLPLLPAGSASAPIQIQVPPDRVIYQPVRTPRPSAAQPSRPVQTAAPSAAPSSVPVSTPAPEVLPTEQTQPAPITVGGILLALWVTGGAAVLGWNLIAHFRFKRYLARWCRPAEDADTIRLFNGLCDSLSLHRRPMLRLCPGLAVPMLAGLFRPLLLLPEEAGGESLRYALLHELIHYRRRDIWLKTLVLWVNAVHWFNPLVWLMVRSVERDTELACDEGALKRLPQEEHAAYGRAILQAVAALRKEKA